jgi:hypothetical protein
MMEKHNNIMIFAMSWKPSWYLERRKHDGKTKQCNDNCNVPEAFMVPGAPQSWYPDVASTRAKYEACVEITLSLGIDHDALMSPQCMQDAIHTLSL